MLPIIRTRNSFPTAFNGLFDDDFFHGFVSEKMQSKKPAVNIRESEKDFQIDVAAPGLDKKDFKIEIEKDILTISSEKEEKSSKEENFYSRKEFSYTNFSRSFSLPESIDIDKIKAKHHNGVLNIILPKNDESKIKKVKQIEIV